MNLPDRDGPGAAERASNWTRFRLLLGDRHGMLATLAIGSVLAGLAESTILAISAQVAAALVAGATVVKMEVGSLTFTETISTLLLIALAVTFARLALQWMVSAPPARIAEAMQTGLRRDLLSAFTEASWGEQASDHEGHLQELATSQASQTTQGTVQAAALVSGLTSLLVLVASALLLNALAAVTVLVAAVALFALLRPLSTLSSRRARELSRAAIQYAGGVNESIRLAQETQVFGTSEAVRDQLDRLIDRLGELYFHTLLLIRLVPGIYQSLIYLLVIIALLGLNAANVGHVASLGAVVLLLVRAGTYGQQVQSTYQGVRQALPYFDRVTEAQRRYRESVPPDGTQALEPVRTLAFEHIYFAYEPGQPTLRDVSFEVSAGEAIGVIGPSGTGKSTVVQILLALRLPDSGNYLINGVPAADYQRADLHRALAYVPQEPRLLHATVAENIRYYRPIDNEAIETAARLAGIHDVVTSWPKGYETIVGPRADAVSGGQQQRICLARALAAQPEVLVLDEPTSALDPHSELLIQESLVALKHKLTLFIVAHRMSTLDVCERVMVLIGGRLDAFDTAAALETSSPYYRSSLAVGAPGPSGGG